MHRLERCLPPSPWCFIVQSASRNAARTGRWVPVASGSVWRRTVLLGRPDSPTVAGAVWGTAQARTGVSVGFCPNGVFTSLRRIYSVTARRQRSSSGASPRCTGARMLDCVRYRGEGTQRKTRRESVVHVDDNGLNAWWS